MERFSASGHPWMVFEVREKGVVIQPDPRPLAKVRRYANMLLSVLRPVEFVSLLRPGRFPLYRYSDVWTMSYDHVKRMATPAHKCILVETVDGARKEFRFGTAGGLRDTLDKFADLGIQCEHG